MKRNKKLSFFQRYSVHFIWRSRNTQISTYRVILEISRAMRNPGLVMCPILSMKVNGSITLSHNYFSIILWQYFELQNLTIQSSQTFQCQFSRIINLNLRSIDASSNNEPLILRYLNLIRGNLKLKILYEFNSPSILLIISQRFAIFLGILNKLMISFSSRHIVCLHPIDLCHLVHQQSINNNSNSLYQINQSMILLDRRSSSPILSNF